MKVLAFTVTRAHTDKRRERLLDTVAQATGKAGMSFLWYFVGSGVTIPEEIKARNYPHREYDENVGQHVAWNDAYHRAMSCRADYLLRIDDDCDFLTNRWLKRLVDASQKLDNKMILAPFVRGLKNPPERSLDVVHNSVRLSFLKDAIGGVCRLHPMSLLREHKYEADVRKALGAGDATGIGMWCHEHKIPMAYVMNIRVRHSTAKQEEADKEYFKNHGIYQKIPYIPALVRV